MNPVIEHFVNIYQKMPLSRKILYGVLLLAVIAGFIVMFIWANKVEYRPLFSNLSTEDAAAITASLKEKRVPYRLTGGGGTIMVPAESVYDVRLLLAGSGLPKGGGVGYEIFDQNDFGTTDFVQKLNHQRALQGELARTIREFDEVVDAKVMIVLPRDSVFIEESKPPSASVLLKLSSDLNSEKVDAVVHLVSSAVEDLKPNQVTVVDTSGRVLFKGISEAEQAKKMVNAQISYQHKLEQDLANRIQTMLERIVGKDKAVVRVTSEMDFDKIDISEEIYDPDVQVVRSRKTSGEDVQARKTEQGNISSVNPVPAENNPLNVVENSKKQEETVNYEISRTIRRTTRPIAALTRLSVAAVIDGKYRNQTGKDGQSRREFSPRTEAEMQQFYKIVEKAMGYNEDRGDQVTVECFPFSTGDLLLGGEERTSDWKAFTKAYGRILANGLLLVLLFLLIIRPVIKTVKEINTSGQKTALPAPDGKEAAEGEDEDLLDISFDKGKESLLPKPEDLPPVEQALYYAREDMSKTTNIIKAWLKET
jgi:flagellar M-ring protein FliF